MPYLCLLQEGNSNLARFIDKANQNNYNVVAVPLNTMEIPMDFETASLNETTGQFTYSDLLLTPEQWNCKVIALLSENIDCDSNDPYVRRNSEQVLRRDISWAEHLQYGGFTMIKLKHDNNVNLARVLTEKIKGVILVQIPLYNPTVAKCSWRSDINEEEIIEMDIEDTWIWWNHFRWAADFNCKLKVVLELNDSEQPSVEVIRRWLGEPLEAVLLPSTLFINNRHNYPVLPKPWQDILKYFVQAHVNIIVSTAVHNNGVKMYAEYLNQFREIHKGTHSLQCYEDVLEIPLQPLYDNLDCNTYDIFEKDPIKYKLYQNAITAALLDRVSESQAVDKLTVIMVLGAGRGPLVRSALNAADNSKRKVRIYIIEKNPNAIRTLRGLIDKLWNNRDIRLFSKDMREFAPTEQADILVSELLGSFGDNELSPECLDCAQRLLKPDGISIPCKSISFINPVMSSKLFNAIRQGVRHEHFARDKQATYLTNSESGFVVLLKNIYNIGMPQPLFEFIHPNRTPFIDNQRYKVLKFKVELDCVITGIAGYFESILYNDIVISINPVTHTRGMLSWFPIYFPFTEPLNVKQNETVEVHFWRCASKQKVWYEWCLNSPHVTHIHNLGGRSYSIYCN